MFGRPHVSTPSAKVCPFISQYFSRFTHLLTQLIVCINQWLLRRNLCPNDRQPLNMNTLKPIPRFMRNLLDKLQIKCDFVSFGCQQVFHLDSLRLHMTVCDFNPEKRVECHSGCGLVLKKADLQNHNCVKSLRKFMSEENQRYEQNLTKIRFDFNSLRNENKYFRSLVNNLQNDVKRLSNEKQLTVISSGPSMSQTSSATVSSISGFHKSCERRPNPFVLITPLQSSMSSMDEPSSSTLITGANTRHRNEEPPFKRRTTTIRVSTPSPHCPTMSSNLSRFQYSNHRTEEIVVSRSPSPSRGRFITSATTLSISNDSNSEADSNAINVSESLSHNYISLDDPDLEENTETGLTITPLIICFQFL